MGEGGRGVCVKSLEPAQGNTDDLTQLDGCFLGAMVFVPRLGVQRAGARGRVGIPACGEGRCGQGPLAPSTSLGFAGSRARCSFILRQTGPRNGIKV